MAVEASLVVVAAARQEVRSVVVCCFCLFTGGPNDLTRLYRNRRWRYYPWYLWRRHRSLRSNRYHTKHDARHRHRHDRYWHNGSRDKHHDIKYFW